MFYKTAIKFIKARGTPSKVGALKAIVLLLINNAPSVIEPFLN